MSQFSITRVELHGATKQSEYDGLHKAMEANGYYRTITGKNGVQNHLPTATYHATWKDGTTVEQVRDEVVSIVQTYWPKPRSFEMISTLGLSAWYNLT